MVLGFERINARQRQPNDRINFIKPLEGPDHAISQDFLERIAAICVPVMKANVLSVMSLEEYPSNPEFWGRNFNAGEVIQLVLRAPDGRWLSFRHVQMVMMHELAHCKQMNHSKAFWKVRNGYCAELKALWERSYTGEGFWSQGQTLSGRYTSDVLDLSGVQPAQLCGGTYQSQRRKRRRKEKPKLSYAEQKQKRITKKFGVSGSALGVNETTRRELESGKNIKGKPRVAGSARGRELRANALLKRLEEQNMHTKSEPDLVVLSDDSTGSEDDEEDYEDIKEEDQAFDIDGKKLRDKNGRGMINTCTAIEEESEEGKDELRQLEMIDLLPDTEVPEQLISVSNTSTIDRSKKKTISKGLATSTTTLREDKGKPRKQEQQAGPSAVHSERSLACKVCSMKNDAINFRCEVCANVLNPAQDAGHWNCKSLACKGSIYVNAGDCGVCGVCGAKKP
jgi:hypothetical protein